MSCHVFRKKNISITICRREHSYNKDWCERIKLLSQNHYVKWDIHLGYPSSLVQLAHHKGLIMPVPDQVLLLIGVHLQCSSDYSGCSNPIRHSSFSAPPYHYYCHILPSCPLNQKFNVLYRTGKGYQVIIPSKGNCMQNVRCKAGHRQSEFVSCNHGQTVLTPAESLCSPGGRSCPC